MKKLKIVTILTSLALCIPLFAQESEVPGYGRLRTNTWSLYVQGGASWGVNVPYTNVNPSFGTNTSPLFGGGVNYNIRPWVRLGLNYGWSWVQREQRYNSVQQMNYPGSRPEYTNIPWTSQKGGLVYSDYRFNHHDIDLTAEFNLAELNPKRKAKWFNVYLGTGVGLMLGNGRIYDLSMGFAEYEDPTNNQGGVQVADNWSYASWLYGKNSTFGAVNRAYIPATLNIEFDVNPSLTLGIKGQYDFIINPGTVAPKGIANAAITIRYNFTGRKHGFKARYNYIKAKNAETVNRLNSEIDALHAALAARDAECNDNLKKLQDENASLQKKVNELEDKLTKMVNTGLKVYFDNASSVVKSEYIPEIAEIAKVILEHPEAEVEIVGEASATGSHSINKRLSEERVAAVVHILQQNGVNYDRITGTSAIGDSAGIKTAEGRRVTISVAGE